MTSLSRTVNALPCRLARQLSPGERPGVSHADSFSIALIRALVSMASALSAQAQLKKSGREEIMHKGREVGRTRLVKSIT
jgi:hypothetical protein